MIFQFKKLNHNYLHQEVELLCSSCHWKPALRKAKPPHADCIKGFNEGCLLAKHDPELFEKLSADLDKSERGAGFKAGKEEYLLDKAKERQTAWMRKDRLSSLKKTIAKNKEKDGLEKG